MLAVVGTRPEAIKMFPVVRSLRERGSRFETLVCSSGQHGELLDDALASFGLEADHDLAAMRHDQQPADVVWEVGQWVTGLCRRLRPDVVLVQGDTATTAAAGLAAFYSKVMLAHVEAGLRTYDNAAPWPEEANRRVVTSIADLHFAPSELAAANLRREGITEDRIHVTGNTSIDALQWALGQPRARPAAADERRRVLVTVHRRESIPDGVEAVIRAVRRLAIGYPDVLFQFFVHPAPAIARSVESLLTEARPDNLKLLEPTGFLPFVQTLADSYLVLTDSGGLQEQGPALGKPVLVVSERTERQESVLAGTGSVVGTDEDEIVASTAQLLDDTHRYADMVRPAEPYGDGHAGERVVSVLEDVLFREGAALGEPALG